MSHYNKRSGSRTDDRSRQPPESATMVLNIESTHTGGTNTNTSTRADQQLRVLENMECMISANNSFFFDYQARLERQWENRLSKVSSSLSDSSSSGTSSSSSKHSFKMEVPHYKKGEPFRYFYLRIQQGDDFT